MAERVTFIRHGQSKANAGAAFSDAKLIELSDLGREQVQRVPHVLRRHRIKPTLIVVSDNVRHSESAEPTAKAFPKAKVEVWDTGEFDYLGSFKISPPTRRAERLHAREAYWNLADPDHRDGEGETFREFIARASAANDRLRRTRRNPVIFGSEWFFKAQLWLLSGNGTEITTEVMRAYKAYTDSFEIPNATPLTVDMQAGTWVTLTDPQTANS